MKTTIYLIRHATPDWNQAGTVYHLPPGPSLTPQGRGEAYALGQYMLQVGIQRLYSSPLQRCLETAQIAGEAARLESILDNRLIEWQPGEDSVTVQTRMVEALESSLQNHLPTSSANSVSIGLISHGGPIGVLLEWLGMKPAELDAYRIYDHKNPLPPAAVWQASRVDQANPWVMGLDFLPDVTLA